MAGGGRQDLATWAVSHSSRFCSPRDNPRTVWHMAKLLSKGLQSLSLSGHLPNSKGPHQFMQHTRLDTSSSCLLPKRWGKAAQEWCWWDQESPAPFPCSSRTWQAPGAGNIRLGQDATPTQHSKTRAVIHRGNHFPWDRGNGSHFLLSTYPIFKVPILTTSITQLAQ